MIRYIYTFFIGLFIALFIGMGIAAFYETPVAPEEPAVLQSIGKEGPTAAQQREINAFHDAQKTYNRQMRHYNMNVSIVVLICAVVILIVALTFSDKLGVVADGILLGGIFTLLYGVGRGMATESSKYRFVVASIGLVVALLLGYLKFSHHTQNRFRTSSAGNVMTQTVLWLLATIILMGGAAYGTYVWQHREIDTLNRQVNQLHTQLNTAKQVKPPAPTFGYTSKRGVGIKLYTPAAKSRVASPVAIMGKVPGNWSFEASFPVKLLDSKGEIIAQQPAHLTGDWMTGELVPFSATLTYSSTASGNGTLVLEKDNPSGLEANSDSVSIPIKL